MFSVRPSQLRVPRQCPAPARSVAPVTRPTSNHLDQALPLGTRSVRFGWHLTTVDAVESVQVIVGQTPAEVRAGVASVWDSGRRNADHPDFSDVCLGATLGSGPGQLALTPEVQVWWAVRIVGERGEIFDWSVPARLILSATVSPPVAPRAVARVTGSLAIHTPQPLDDESLFRWLAIEGAGAVWPLVCSVDVSARVAGWLNRLRAQLRPGDTRTAELYCTLLDAADLCYDDAELRAAHASSAHELLRAAADLQPAGATASFAHGAGTARFPAPTGHSLTDLLAPLLGSGDPSTPLPVGIVVGEVAGLRPTAPGYRSFKVEPCLLPQATEVDVEVDTPRGAILVKLSRRADTLAGAKVTLGVPTGAVATLVLPWSGEELVLDAGCYVFVNS